MFPDGALMKKAKTFADSCTHFLEEIPRRGLPGHPIGLEVILPQVVGHPK